jgi:hypothetical protein
LRADDTREDGFMSIFDKLKVKAQELLGRAEQVYGESHGDAAASVAGEANVMEAAAEEEELDREEHRRHDDPRDDDGMAGAR